MREKTLYGERPEELEIFPGDTGESIVVFRKNIEEVHAEGDETCYRADEYRLKVPTTSNLETRVFLNHEAWEERAIREDYEEAAKTIRKKRDALLSETDYLMQTDYPITPERREAFEEYRQTLRDIPEQEGFPYDVVFPVKPQ